MKSIYSSPFLASLLLAAAPHLAAQAPAQPVKLVSRDELRVCMDTESELLARRAAIDARAKVNVAERDAIRAAGAEMLEEQKRVEGDERRMDRFNRKVKAHNDRVQAANANVEAVRKDLETLNAGLVAYNQKCGGISFNKEDKDAILKEREAAKK